MGEDNHEILTEEEATSAVHVGLWKILAGGLALVIVGFALVSGINFTDFSS